MPRITKGYDERHAEFLEVAQQLFFSKGYEQTSIQTIIDTVGVAKGTFYHYFSSKTEILDALIRDMYGSTLVELEPMVASSTLTATEKLEKLFQHINHWQSENREFLIASTKALYQDVNVILRTKMEATSQAMLVPLLGDILHQGIASGEFSLKHPAEIAQIIIKMGTIINETAVPLIIAERCTLAEVEELTQKILAFRYAMARLIGIEESKLNIVDLDELSRWLTVEAKPYE